MSQKSVEQFIGRLITDTLFCEKALRGLEAVCFEEGYELTHVERNILASMDFKKLSQIGELLLDDKIKRFAI